MWRRTYGRTDVRTYENWKASCRPAPLGSGKNMALLRLIFLWFIRKAQELVYRDNFPLNHLILDTVASVASVGQTNTLYLKFICAFRETKRVPLSRHVKSANIRFV